MRSLLLAVAGTLALVSAASAEVTFDDVAPLSTETVRWGDPTTDEMMIGGLDFIAVGGATNE